MVLISVLYNCGLLSISNMALDMSLILCGSTIKAASPAISGIALVLDVITGTLHFMASIIGNPNPSNRETKHNAFEEAKKNTLDYFGSIGFKQID